MVEIIGKELLSKVLGEEILSFNLKNNEIFIQFGNYDDIWNIYELEHKCKEWALKYDCMLNSWYTEEQSDSSLGQMAAVCNIYHSFTSFEDIVKSFEADTEPEAIFKACQWILDYKDNK